MKKQKRILITGGLGLIGSAIANDTKDEVIILSRSNIHIDRLKNKNTKVLIKELKNVTKEDLKDVDVIYNCASNTSNYSIFSDPYLDVNQDLVGIIHLLELCKEMNTKPKIVYLSTFFVYGNIYDKTKIPITEESQTDPLATYPAAKLCAESIIKFYGKLFEIPYLICRLTNVYGEMESFNDIKKGALNYLIMEAVKGHVLKIYNNGDFYRDYIHVDDVVSALHALESKKNDLYLIGSGSSVKFKDIIGEIINLTGSISRVESMDPPRFHKIVGINNFITDTSKINSLGWKPTISYKEGVKRVIERYKSLNLVD